MINEIKQEVNKVIDSGKFILGEQGRLFEEEVCKFLKCRYAIGVNSGTDALVLALTALGIGRGDEVITSPFTFVATAEAIVRVGATPVFVDVNEDKLIDWNKIGNAITPKTKAILPVNLFGKIVDLAMREFGLPVIEDSAQAFGVKTFRLGEMECFSFHPSKILGGLGDGGMIITDNFELATKLRMLRNHGSSLTEKYNNVLIGFNSRLDEIQAAALRVKLRYFREIESKFKMLEGRYYPRPLHLQPCFEYLGYKDGDFPMAEKFALEIKNYGKQNLA